MKLIIIIILYHCMYNRDDRIHVGMSVWILLPCTHTNVISESICESDTSSDKRNFLVLEKGSLFNTDRDFNQVSLFSLFMEGKK